MALRRASPWLAGAILMCATALFAQSLKNNEALQKHDVLEVAADRIKQRISTQISALYAVRALFLGSENVTRQEFREFAEAIGIFGRARGMQGLGFAIARNGEIDDVEIRARLQRDYGIDRGAWPKSDQKDKFPIVYLEPDDARNRAALGYDMFTQKTRREAMRRAWDEDRDVATRPLTLVQEIDDDKQIGFLIYLPLFAKPQEQGADGAGGGKPIKGFVYAAFRAGDLLQTVLSEKPAVEVDIRAYSDEISKDMLLFSNVSEMEAPSVHKIEVAGHDWLLELEDRSASAAGVLSPWVLVLALGSLLSAALGCFVYLQLDRADAAERASRLERQRAEEKDILLKEMTHRLKNVISRIVSIARVSAKGTDDKDEFVSKLGGRLQAMAAAQELLSKSDGQKTTIRDLVSREFEILFGPESEQIRIEGPHIQVDENQSQALGLIVHELATNSAKYGAIKHDGKVTLDISVQSNGQRMAGLEWIESGVKGTPDFSKEGFGSKLLKMMAEGQLRGEFNRDAVPGKVQISILFPVSN